MSEINRPQSLRTDGDLQRGPPLPSVKPSVGVKLSTAPEILPLREQYRGEMNCQITKDSIHQREGWARSYFFDVDGCGAGFGSVAVAGPWKDKPTIFEFYVLPEHRPRSFDLFEAFLAASDGRFFEVQSNDVLLTVMLHTYGRDVTSESIVFHQKGTTHLPSNGAVVRRLTSEQEIRACIEARRGGGEWLLEQDGEVVAKGGILFHYNIPYGDIYMDVTEPFRQRGFGSYLVQELIRECYGLGAIPCARCNPTNIPSRRTLLRAGFVPFAHILNGSVHSPRQDRKEGPGTT